MEAEDTSLMDDLASAWESAEGASNDDTQQESVAEETTASELSGEQPGSAGTDPAVEGMVQGGDEQGDIEPQDQALPESSTDTAVESKAPVGMPPETREEWKGTPKAVQDWVAKRENDFAQGIQKYAESAKRAQAMDQALAPYQQLFATNGGQPGEVIGSVLQTASVLQMGTPIQKAQVLAGIVKQFGVDIQALDNALVGEAPPKEVQQSQMLQSEIQRALAPYQQQLQTYQQREQMQVQQAQYQVQSELEQFAGDPKNEFYSDVRMDMADIMDMAAQRNQEISLQDAYDRACAIHPQIGKILRARESQSEVNQKSLAATSIHGSPSGEGGETQQDNLRDIIANAWEGAGRV